MGNVPSVLVSETIKILIFPLPPFAKNQFLIEVILICAVIILFIFLILIAFSVVVRSGSSDSQLAEI